ncbi:SurA N-terminal domain-containing protein [Metabacillus herbersteinensis]|uniref:SurA N-terminal domain-containing protein n=1 Tax=Metabacillus herbersteinensis TaxID=283816 RepID=A0ABV6GFX2_9BACI
MKKWMYTIMIGLMAVALAACNGDDEAKEPKEEEKTEEGQAAEEGQPSEEEQAAAMEEMQKKLEAQQVEDDKVVAIVNDQELKGIEYNGALAATQMQYQQMGQDPTTDELAKQIKEGTIETLIGQTLLLQEADKKGYKATDEDINKEIDTLKANYEDDKAFEEALKTNKITLDELKKQVADNVKYTQYVEKDVKVEEVTDEEAKEFYEQMASQGDAEQTPEFEEVKDNVKQQLQGQKTQEKLAQVVADLKKKAKIDIKI